MDVIINEMTSTVRAMDSQSMLSPQVVEHLVKTMLARMKEHQRHEQSVEEERKMRPSMTSREISFWE